MFRSKGDPPLLPIGRARPDTTILPPFSYLLTQPPSYPPLCGLRASIYLSHAVPCAPIPTHSTHQPTNSRLIHYGLCRGAEPPAASVCQNNREIYTLLHWLSHRFGVAGMFLRGLNQKRQMCYAAQVSSLFASSFPPLSPSTLAPLLFINPPKKFLHLSTAFVLVPLCACVHREITPPSVSFAVVVVVAGPGRRCRRCPPR